MPHFTDKFSQPAPWENPRLSDETDWSDEQLVIGGYYKKHRDTEEIVHSEELQDYIREKFEDYIPED